MLNFITGYNIDEEDRVMMEPQRIAIRYLRTWFIIDLVSTM